VRSTLTRMTYAWFLIALFVVLPGACQLGFWLGRGVAARKGDKDESERSHAVAWQASLLALAALLIGFTFSMAQARYDHRKAIVLAEANDIGTTYLRTRLLDDTRGDPLRALIRRYVDARLAFNEAGADRGRIEEILRQSAALGDQIWIQVAAAARAAPSPTTSLLVQSTNEMLDASEEHVAAMENPLPPTVFFVLLLVTAVAMGAVGYECGLEARMHALGMLVAPLLLAVVIGLVFDLAHPRLGIIKVHDPILTQLRKSF
jgi:hypothetical protein